MKLLHHIIAFAITTILYFPTSYADTIPAISQEEIIYDDIPAVRISMMISLDYITYLAIGISNNGFMVRSPAVVGSVDESINDNDELLVDTGTYTTKEYILGGKFTELITPTPDDEKVALMSNFTIDYLQESGLYNHTLEVILRKDTDICGKNIGIGGKRIIWSYSSYDSPSTVLAIHSTKTRGLHPLPIMCEEEFDLEESSDENDELDTSILNSSSSSPNRSKSVVLPIVVVLLFIGLFIH